MAERALASPTADSVMQILVWGGVLLLAVIVLFGATWYYRRRWLNWRESTGGTPWTLDDLSRMREAGQITEEEYRTLRATLAAAFRGSQADTARKVSPDWPVKIESQADKNAPDFDLRKGPEG